MHPNSALLYEYVSLQKKSCVYKFLPRWFEIFSSLWDDRIIEWFLWWDLGNHQAPFYNWENWSTEKPVIYPRSEGILVRVLQRNRPIGPNRRFITGIGLQDHGGWKVPRSARWRPRKAGGVIHSVSKGLRTGGADDVNPRLMAGEAEMRCHAIREKGANSSFLCLLFYPGSRPWGGPSSPESSSSNANLTWKHHHTHPETV